MSFFSSKGQQTIRQLLKTLCRDLYDLKDADAISKSLI